jgi:hypothetical protein
MRTDWTHCTTETVAAAIQATRAERIANGLDPDTAKPLRVPVNASVRQIIHWPFRMSPDVQRSTELYTVLEDLQREGYTSSELLEAVQKLKAAEEGGAA